MSDTPELTPLDEDWERALVVAAHPDDIEYGLAMAVARWTSQGKHVSYLLATRGEAGIDGMSPDETGPLRVQEQQRAAAVVGVGTVEFLDHKDGQIEYGPPLRRDIARVIRRHRPDVVASNTPALRFGPGLLNSADHRAVGLATLDAANDAGNRWIFTELLAQGLEPWGGVRAVCLAASPTATHAVDVSGFVDKGVESLHEHRMYFAGLKGSPDPEPFLRQYAREVGGRMGWEAGIDLEVFVFG